MFAILAADCTAKGELTVALFAGVHIFSDGTVESGWQTVELAPVTLIVWVKVCLAPLAPCTANTCEPALTVTDVFSDDCPVLKNFTPSSHADNDTRGSDELVPATTFMGEVTVAPFFGVQIVTDGSVELCGHGGVGVKKKST